MKHAHRKRLEKAGFKIGTIKELLALSDEDVALIEMKRALIGKLREIRQTNELTQTSLAELLGSSQSRVAKMEAGALDVSLDLICRALFSLGVDRRTIGRVLAGD